MTVWPQGWETWKNFRHHKGKIAYVASALFCFLSPGRRLAEAEVLMMLMWVTKIRNGRTSRRKRIVLLPRSLGVLRPLEAVVVALTAWVQQQQQQPLLQAPTTQLAYCKAEAEAGSGRTSRGASLTKPCWSRRRRRRRRRSWTATAPVTSRSAWWGDHIINHDYFSIPKSAAIATEVAKLELNLKSDLAIRKKVCEFNNDGQLVNLQQQAHLTVVFWIWVLDEELLLKLLLLHHFFVVANAQVFCNIIVSLLW